MILRYAERSKLINLHGCYVGMLTPDELELFERGVKYGYVKRVYEGFMGLMGVAKVRLVLS